MVDMDSEEVTQGLDQESTEGQDRFASCSPDGKRLVFHRVRAKREEDRSEGAYQTAASAVNLPAKPLEGTGRGAPRLVAQRSLIDFSTRPLLEFSSGRSELYTIRPDGSVMHALTINGEGGPRAT
jgi:Tol biopolymer transport system component